MAELKLPLVALSFLFYFVERSSCSPEAVRKADRLRRNTDDDLETFPYIQRIWDFHPYYSTAKLQNVSQWYWQELEDDDKHQTLSDSPGDYRKIHVDFEFGFYGHTMRRIYLSTAGMLSMSPSDEDSLPVSHYIAPFYGNFNPSFSKDSAIFFESKGNRFAVEWRNVYLRNNTDIGPFNFQTIVYKNGTVVFVYKTVHLPQNITIGDSEFLIGIVGSIPLEIAGIKILAYYDPVQVFPLDIENGTVVIFTPLPTCDSIKELVPCVLSELDFKCTWCSATQKCYDALDKYTSEWRTSGCLREERLNSKPRSTISSQTSKPESSHSSSKVGVAIVVVVVVVLVAALGGFFLYAYRNPTSKSGIWLMEHRPSQWKSLFTKWKGFSRQNEGQTPY